MSAIKRKMVSQLLKTAPGESVLAKGWVRTKRGNKSVVFIALNDGSTINNIQIVCDTNHFSEQLFKDITTGACIAVTGKLVESLGKGQSVEIQAEEITLYGKADPELYPLQKKGHSMEFLREIAHLRPRTNTFGAVLRIRHAMAFAIHNYFNSKGFYYLHTPIITASDCEGAGEMFQVTTLDLNNVPRNEAAEVDFSQDFFGRQTSLTVSGQLEGELGAMALGQIYTFGPTFRAENSNTTRHLAEFWMIEPEMAFFDLTDNMDLAEEFVKYLLNWALTKCTADMKFFDERIQKGLIDTLTHVVNSDFARITYTEAVEALEKNAQAFEFKPYWGCDLQSEHEKYLTEVVYKRPVIVTDYPKEIKAFYMKLNEDGKTVRAMDVLVPGLGEIIGGSEREADYTTLLERIKTLDLNPEDYWWYLDLRKFGTVPHSGFGLGFERLLLYVTGMGNIRDVIPYPRAPNLADF